GGRGGGGGGGAGVPPARSRGSGGELPSRCHRYGQNGPSSSEAWKSSGGPDSGPEPPPRGPPPPPPSPREPRSTSFEFGPLMRIFVEFRLFPSLSVHSS